MEQARLYHSKLVNIKKTMLMMHEKTASLKVSLWAVYLFKVSFNLNFFARLISDTFCKKN